MVSSPPSGGFSYFYNLSFLAVARARPGGRKNKAVQMRNTCLEEPGVARRKVRTPGRVLTFLMVNYNACSSGLRFCFKANADTNMRYVHCI